MLSVLASPIVHVPPLNVVVPVLVIADDPLLIEPKPEVIVPLFNAPVETRLGIAVI